MIRIFLCKFTEAAGPPSANGVAMRLSPTLKIASGEEDISIIAPFARLKDLTVCPEPASNFAPAKIVTPAEAAIDPLTFSVPPFTVVAPVYVFSPDKVHMLVLALVTATVPEVPLAITPVTALPVLVPSNCRTFAKLVELL